MKRTVSIIAIAAVLLCAFCIAHPAMAKALDEILLYEITVNVNQDGTLYMVYHIDWEVLDSSTGGVSWVSIGIPNSHCTSFAPISPAVKGVTYEASGGSYVRVDLDREYMEGEVIDIRFDLVQDYMYEMNYLTEGETHYEFTPGWFDEITVDSIIVRWNTDRAISASPANMVKDGYYTWSDSLQPGDTMTVSVEYPNDAFGFDETKSFTENNNNYYYSGSNFTWLPGLFVMAAMFFVVFFIVRKIRSAFAYNETANLGGAEAAKKITREKIIYYPECPGCGAPRPEGKDNCEYCGKSLIKSKETVTEEQVPEEIKQKTSNGTYHYGPDPNTFMRVHVVPLPVVKPRSSINTSGSRSSCAHSSCACASHCACACACACAGGGRAGCTVKDFYDTGLKLSALEKRCKK